MYRRRRTLKRMAEIQKKNRKKKKDRFRKRRKVHNYNLFDWRIVFMIVVLAVLCYMTNIRKLQNIPFQ